MEEINRRIVSLLSRDGRMSFTELARQTGLSVSAAQQRVRCRCRSVRGANGEGHLLLAEVEPHVGNSGRRVGENVSIQGKTALG